MFNANKSITAQTAADGVANVKIIQDNLDFQLVVGKWAYLHHAEVYSSLSPKAEIEILLDKGYQDDFILEQNWTTKPSLQLVPGYVESPLEPSVETIRHNQNPMLIQIWVMLVMLLEMAPQIHPQRMWTMAQRFLPVLL